MSLQEKKLQKLKEHSMVAGDHCWHDSRRFQARENGEWRKRKRRGRRFRFVPCRDASWRPKSDRESGGEKSVPSRKTGSGVAGGRGTRQQEALGRRAERAGPEPRSRASLWGRRTTAAVVAAAMRRTRASGVVVAVPAGGDWRAGRRGRERAGSAYRERAPA